MSTPRQHHILPAFYLAGFTDTGTKDGTLHVYDHLRGRYYDTTPEKVARERDFYRIYKPGVDNNVLEERLATLEGKIAPVLRRVKETDTASPEELGTLLSLAAMIHVRGQRGLERAYIATEDQMRRGLQDGTLTAEAWEEVRELLTLEGEDPASLVSYEEARRKALDDGDWSPIAPRDYVLSRLIELHAGFVDSLLPHPWSMAVANPSAGEFICSNSPLTWSSEGVGAPGFKEDEDFRDPGVTVMFPINNNAALITRPQDRGSKQRGFLYEAVDGVVAWVNSRTLFLSYGTVYSGSKDFVLLQGNKVRRGIDYFRHVERFRRGTSA